MKTIPTLFAMSDDGDHLVRNAVTHGCGWVMEGEGTATELIDGQPHFVSKGILYLRHDLKVSEEIRERLEEARKEGVVDSCEPPDFPECPKGWIEVEDPNLHSGHWPGWLAVDPEDPSHKWSIDAWEKSTMSEREDGTYELVGPKVQSNPYGLSEHRLVRHGSILLSSRDLDQYQLSVKNLRSFAGIRAFLQVVPIEGIVWWKNIGDVDCVKTKLKRKDFGFAWPVEGASL